MRNPPAFHAWFGKSCAVENDGRTPLVLYHGTDCEFEAFSFTDESGLGPFLVTNRDIAADYGRVLEVHVRIENPFEIDYETWIAREGVPTSRELLARGHDGVLIRDFSSNGEDSDADEESQDFGDVYIPLVSPTQIKAVDNLGVWGRDDARLWDPLESTCRHASLSIL